MNDLAAELQYRREQRLVAQEMAMDTQTVASTAASSGTPNMGHVIGKDAENRINNMTISEMKEELAKTQDPERKKVLADEIARRQAWYNRKY